MLAVKRLDVARNLLQDKKANELACGLSLRHAFSSPFIPHYIISE